MADVKERVRKHRWRANTEKAAERLYRLLADQPEGTERPAAALYKVERKIRAGRPD
jgi:hypothetical protein